MKKKINLRLVVIAILAILTTMIGITVVYYGLFKKQIRHDLSVSAKLLKDTKYFESVNIDTDDIDLSTDINELRVTWVAADGTVLYDNDAGAENLGNHGDRPEIKEAFETGIGETVRQSDTMKKNTFYYATLLDNGTVLRVATDAESMWAVSTTTAPLILIIILVIIAICIALSHMLTKQLISPIEEMAENIEDVSTGTPYKELKPFVDTIRKQHADILSAAKARQDFTANVSHELKTPLTAISGYAELLENGMVGKEQEKHFYQEIRKNSDRLLALISDIIRLSELDRSEKQPKYESIDLYDVAEECMDNLSVSAERRKVNIKLTGEHCNIHGNSDMIRELIENLAQNAIRYNNPGGHVTIMVLNRERPTLLVKDDGIGIPVSEQDRVFERFYRVDKSRSKATGGTGLGLAIVKHIVELHDAQLSLDSAVGVGTTMKVEF